MVSAAAHYQYQGVVRFLLGELHARSLVALEKPGQGPATQKPDRVSHEPEPKLDQQAPGTFQSLLKDRAREGVRAGGVARLSADFSECGEQERTIRINHSGLRIWQR